MELLEFIHKHGQKYSAQLNIQVKRDKFKWFLASMLFGARISESIAINTYKEFERRGLITAEKILKYGWHGLVDSLDRGGYVRYDFKTADKLLEASNNLIRWYGSLENLHRSAANAHDLETKIKNLSKGIGEVTVGIFLRELRSEWEKADPLPGKLSLLAGKNLGIVGKEPLRELKHFCIQNKIDLVSVETALVRLGKDYCRKNKCVICPLANVCELGG